jgi:6-phosphogluconolactonase
MCPQAFIAVNPQTAPYARISMTLPRIVSTSALFLHIVGDEKKRVLETALRNTKTASPIVNVLAAGASVANVFWCPSNA